MKKLALIAAAFLGACITQAPPGEDLGPESLAVYEAFLTGYAEEGRVLNLANRSTTLNIDADAARTCAGDDITFPDLAAVSQRTRPLSALAANPRVRLVEAEAQRAIIAARDPSTTIAAGRSVDEAVDDAFAAGLLQLSDVAFSADGGHALMRFSFVCGALCGHGELVHFVRENGAWSRASRRCSGWVS
ncbi:MAG: hypothetical protein R3C16_06805 [Hyphomonadaceae bacterium]